MTAHIERIIEIAMEAGRRTLAFGGGASSAKADGSPVSAADRASHVHILRELQQGWPDVPVISEEGSVPHFDRRRHWSLFWLVDPLDGTKEFLAGNGEFTVNIALIDHGAPVLGVIVAPVLRATYFAARGAGAWRRLGGGATERIQAAARPSTPLRVVESRSHPSPELEAYLASLGPIERIKLGSSLKFCRLAEGAADLYPRFGPMMEWDYAAGDCVYRYSGAGGRELASPFAYNQPALRTAGFVLGPAAEAFRPPQLAIRGRAAG